MDSFYIFKFVILPFISYLTFNNNTSAIKTKEEKIEPTIDGLIIRLKKGLATFTDCSVDTLLKHCTKETSVNFECFRTLGTCVSRAVREALVDSEEDFKKDEL